MSNSLPNTSLEVIRRASSRPDSTRASTASSQQKNTGVCHMRTKYHFSTLLAAVGLAVGAFGFGVARADAADASAAGSAASSSGQTLEEILVTAEKFGVDVMHAPVSVTAINGDDLQ